MRLSILLPSLAVALLLAACSGRGPGSDAASVCAAQAEMAEQGRMDGRAMTITCP